MTQPQVPTTTPPPAPASGPARLRHRPPWVRVLSIVLSVVWVGVVFVVGGFLTIASPVGGWFYATLCFLPGLVGTVLLFGVTRGRDALLAASALSLACGFAMYQQAPPDHGRIEAVAEDAGIPVAGWELVGTGQSGNTWCWKGCPEVAYYYAADGSPGEAMATLGATFEEAGWRGGLLDPTYGRERSEYTPLSLGGWRKGRWEVELSVPPPAARFGWSAEVERRGLTPVEVSFDAGQ